MPFKSLGKNLCFQYSFLCQLKACTQIPLLLLLWHRALLSLLGCRLVLNKTNVFTGEQRVLLYHIITSHFICRDLQLLQSIEEPIHFLLSKAVNIFYECIVYLGYTLLSSVTQYIVSVEITSDKCWRFVQILGYSCLLSCLGLAWLLCHFPPSFPYILMCWVSLRGKCLGLFCLRCVGLNCCEG